MSWYYVSGGLLLWVVDHIIRLSRSVGHTVNVEKISIMGSGNIVCLGYKVSSTQSIFSGDIKFSLLTEPMVARISIQSSHMSAHDVSALACR